MLPARQTQNRGVVVDLEAISFTIDHYLSRAWSAAKITPLFPSNAVQPGSSPANTGPLPRGRCPA